MLLNEVLETPSEALEPSDSSRNQDMQVVNPVAALNDINITLLSPDNAARILKLRIDWPLNN